MVRIEKLTVCGREAVRWMLNPSGASASEEQSAPASTASRGLRAVESAFEAAIGMDEPPV